MASPRDLRRRINSIRTTAQITRAMQMVAASKMRKAQQAATAAAPFSRLLYRIQRSATLRAAELPASAAAGAPGAQTRAVILIAADKGLCGSLNTNVFRVAAQFRSESTVYITAGRKAAQFIARTRRQLAAEFAYGDTPTFAEARAIAVVRAGPVPEGRSRPGARRRHPLRQHADPEAGLHRVPAGRRDHRVEDARARSPTRRSPQEATDVRVRADAEALLAYLLGHYLNIYIYYVMLNAKASEQSARMVSMKNATDSAESLIKELSLEYNKLRQGNITRELLEIAGGQAG